jgi:hypothetical protein
MFRTLTLDLVGQQLELTKQHSQRLVTGLRTAGFIKPVRLRAGFPSSGASLTKVFASGVRRRPSLCTAGRERRLFDLRESGKIRLRTAW